MRLRDFLRGHDQLNPKLFLNDRQLRPEVKEQLILLGMDFLRSLPLELNIIDLRLVGAQTGLFYTKFSDIDLHWVADFSQDPCERITRSLLDLARREYNRTSSPRVNAIPVELYVESHLEPASGGAYSLLADQWLVPATSPQISWDILTVNRQLKQITRLIKLVIKWGSKQQKIRVLDNLYQLRQRSLSSPAGEFSRGNVVFKIIRNRGLLAKLRNSIKRAE